ncbi:MAG: hypothetical protein AAF789_11785, partial [Bacteroidota bacterium]
PQAEDQSVQYVPDLAGIGGGHNDLYTHEEYHRMLEEIMRSQELKPIDPAETSISFIRSKKNKAQ